MEEIVFAEIGLKVEMRREDYKRLPEELLNAIADYIKRFETRIEEMASEIEKGIERKFGIKVEVSLL